MALAEAAPLSSAISSDEDLSAPEGWKKKVLPKKGGTPKKKDVVYIAPDGDEIKNKRQLDKWLKNNPGSLSAADFDWSTGETPRRSARLSSKGRLSSDNLDGEPASKRSKSDQDDDYVIVSPRKASKRKSAPSGDSEEITDAADNVDVPPEAGTDGVSVDADANAENISENNIAGKLEKEDAIATVLGVEQADLKEQIATEEAAIPANSTDAVVVDELRGEEPVVVTETVVADVTPVVTLEGAVPDSTDGLLATGDAGIDITMKDVEDVQVPAPVDSTDQLHDVLKPTETIEVQESHAVVDEATLLSGVVT